MKQDRLTTIDGSSRTAPDKIYEVPVKLIKTYLYYVEAMSEDEASTIAGAMYVEGKQAGSCEEEAFVEEAEIIQCQRISTDEATSCLVCRDNTDIT